jgi:hypothetical protein
VHVCNVTCLVVLPHLVGDIVTMLKLVDESVTGVVDEETSDSSKIIADDQFPVRLVLNSQSSKEIEWHCKHYVGRGLMKRFESGEALAERISSRLLGVSVVVVDCV